MKRAMLGAILCLVWAALTAWEHLRQRPAPEDEVQPPDPYTVYLVTLGRGDPRIGTFSRN
jgi:hypothetical protein